MMLQDCRVRPALASEAAALSELATRSKAHWGYSAAFMEACREELSYTSAQIASERYSFRVVESDSLLLGFFAIEWLPDEACELEALFVDPRVIGRGIGRTLMQQALSLAGERGMHRMTVQGDPHARRFYVAAGGKESGQRESSSISGRLLPVFEYRLRPDAATPETREAKR